MADPRSAGGRADRARRPGSDHGRPDDRSGGERLGHRPRPPGGAGARPRRPGGAGHSRRRQCARPGGACRPPDPELDVRVGGRARAGDLLRGAGDAVAPAAAPARAPQAAGPHPDRGGLALRSGRRRPVRARGLQRVRRHQRRHLELRADLHLRPLLGRPRDPQRGVRRRVPRAEPMAGRGAGRGMARPWPAARAAAVSGLAGPLAGRDQRAGLRLGRAGLRRQGRPHDAGRPGPGLRRRAAAGDGGVRRSRRGAATATGSGSTTAC